MKILKRSLLIIIVLAALISIGGIVILNLPQFGEAPSGAHLSALKKSPQHNGSFFENYGNVKMEFDIKDSWKMIELFINKPEDSRPLKSIEIRELDETVLGTDDSTSHLTWFGHSAFLLEMDGKIILLDPMLGPSAAPFEFQVKRFEKKLPLELESFPHIDYVIFSHDHYDHLDYSTVLKLKDRIGHFYVPLGLKSHLVHWGVEEARVTEFDWWDEIEVDGITLACTPSQHFSGRGINDRAKTLWASWVIRGKRDNIYFSGDSGYFPEFKKIGAKYGPFDLALMECGQYNELWHAIHMLPEETAQAGIDVGAKVMMPIHWGMFDLSVHSWTEPVERVTVAASKLNLPLITPVIGQRFEIKNYPETSDWWNH